MRDPATLTCRAALAGCADGLLYTIGACAEKRLQAIGRKCMVGDTSAAPVGGLLAGRYVTDLVTSDYNTLVVAGMLRGRPPAGWVRDRVWLRVWLRLLLRPCVLMCSSVRAPPSQTACCLASVFVWVGCYQITRPAIATLPSAPSAPSWTRCTFQ